METLNVVTGNSQCFPDMLRSGQYDVSESLTDIKLQYQYPVVVSSCSHIASRLCPPSTKKGTTGLYYFNTILERFAIVPLTKPSHLLLGSKSNGCRIFGTILECDMVGDLQKRRESLDDSSSDTITAVGLS